VLIAPRRQATHRIGILAGQPRTPQPPGELQGANTLSEASCRQMLDVMQAAKHGLSNDLPIVRFGD
jgi:hypothetical protein